MSDKEVPVLPVYDRLVGAVERVAGIASSDAQGPCPPMDIAAMRMV